MGIKNKTKSQNSVIRSLVIMNIVLVLGIVGAVWGNYASLQNLTISTPPDLRKGALLKPGEKYPEDVWMFTAVNFQAVQTWETNGELDYKRKIEKLRPFWTKDFRNQLMSDYENRRKNGELDSVERQMTLPVEYVFDEESVRVVDNNTWIVFLPLQVEEYVHDGKTKDIEVLYSFVVRRKRTNIKENVFQIAIDSYYEEPIRTKDYLSEKGVVKHDTRKLINEL